MSEKTWTDEFKKLKDPAMVSGVAVGIGLLSKHLLGMSFGTEANMKGSIKAFILITASGYVVQKGMEENTKL